MNRMFCILSITISISILCWITSFFPKPDVKDSHSCSFEQHLLAISSSMDHHHRECFQRAEAYNQAIVLHSADYVVSMMTIMMITIYSFDALLSIIIFYQFFHDGNNDHHLMIRMTDDFCLERNKTRCSWLKTTCYRSGEQTSDHERKSEEREEGVSRTWWHSVDELQWWNVWVQPLPTPKTKRRWVSWSRRWWNLLCHPYDDHPFMKELNTL